MAEETTGNVTSVDEELLEKIEVDVSQEKGNLSKRKNHISGTVAAWIKSFSAMISAVQTEVRSLNVKNGTGKGSLITGGYTQANEDYTFAAGSGNTALKKQAAVFGKSNRSAGVNAFVIGLFNKALSDNQFVRGKYCIPDDTGKYVEIVGNGTDSGYSNAYTLDWEGNGWFAGSVEATSLILKSSTPGSAKKFRLTIDDTGTITTAEI